MKKAISIVLVMVMIMAFSTSSYAKKRYVYKVVEPMAFDEPQKIRCTCYYEHQKTCTGIMPYYGIAAGREEWLGYVCELNRVNPDGSIGEFIGYFEFKDTGAGMDSDGDGKGDTIKNGTSIDVWVETRADAYAWVGEYGDYVYIKLIKGKG